MTYLINRYRIGGSNGYWSLSNNVIRFPTREKVELKEPSPELQEGVEIVEDTHRAVLITHLITDSVARKILVDMEANDIDWEDPEFLEYHELICNLLQAALYDVVGQDHPFMPFLKTMADSLEDEPEGES